MSVIRVSHSWLQTYIATISRNQNSREIRGVNYVSNAKIEDKYMEKNCLIGLSKFLVKYKQLHQNCD